tara:strand:- start:480 stop:1397 length:918 start_codon:yes stop_codon:yes gene_type:complete
MISICIPIYNFDCTDLIKSLYNQIENKKVQIEIILMDDGSNETQLKKLENIDKYCRFYALEQNVGRAKIRNLLAKKATYQNLLFIDGDSAIISNDFIADYLKIIENQPNIQVICGGSIYQTKPPSKDFILRWEYSRKREGKTAKQLKEQPYKSFTTNNFIIKKALFQSIQFDERIDGYGHEDTLLGFRLMELNSRILHVNNPVLNQDLDTNRLFLDKTEESIHNLIEIDHFLGGNKAFRSLVPLLKTYHKLKSIGFSWMLTFARKLFYTQIRLSLEKGGVNLFFFDLYRLMQLAKIEQTKKAKYL